jgi:hypothetical protein
MEMRKGFAGLLMLSVFMLGFVLLLGSNSPRVASKGYSSIVSAEIHSDRVAIARNVLIKSYKEVDEKNRNQWADAAEGELSRLYGLKIGIDLQKFPAEANITDPQTGMSTSFFLLK